MLKDQRRRRILAMLQREGAVDLAELGRAMPEVSQVTLRRDIAALADAGALKRTHGGALPPDDALVHKQPANDRDDVFLGVDAHVLPPIEERGGGALRRRIRNSGAPFLAESAPQQGGAYLGPDNGGAAAELGWRAGDDHRNAAATILLVGHHELENTRERACGFVRGFRARFSGETQVVRVNGAGNYKQALRVAKDAFAANPAIDVVFGVNDHSALAGIDAAAATGRRVAVYATGGEDPAFVARLSEDGPLRAVAAFFPDVVGAIAIDRIARRLEGGDLAAEPTPHAILSGADFATHYEEGPTGWRLRADRKNAMVGHVPERGGRKARIGFMPHYPAHDWYRTMIQAMRERAEAHGFELVVTPPHERIVAEIARLRRAVAEAAAARVRAGAIAIVGQGEIGRGLALALRRRAFERPRALEGTLIVTNDLDVLTTLDGAPGLKALSTSGEYQKADHCLVGPSLGALFERLRADVALLSVDGVSADFGLSSVDERLALAGSRFVAAARRTIALADHIALGADANHRIARADGFHELITDDGALPSDRQALRDAGIEVSIADEADQAAHSANEPIEGRST